MQRLLSAPPLFALALAALGPAGLGACDAAVCTAGATRCSADDPHVVERCAADGTGWEARPACPGELACTSASGVAACQACIPSVRSCAFGNQAQNGVVEECNADGTAVEVVESCLEGSCFYDGTTSTCRLPCEPGRLSCNPLGSAVVVCDAGGESFSNHQGCTNNSCQLTADGAECGVAPVCAAGATRCGDSDANVVERCKVDETGWETQTTCADPLLCTTAAGAATCQTCVPGARSCGANNAAVQECDADGVGHDVVQSCLEGSCVDDGDAPTCLLPCEPGRLSCGPQDASVVVCDAGGESFSTHQACLDNSCQLTADGAECGVLPACDAGATRCGATDANVVERCTTDETGWEIQTTCAGQLVCTTAAGAAACQTCVPGARSCGANNATVQECDADGLGYDVVQSCLEGSCVDDGDAPTCLLPCEPGLLSCGPQDASVVICDAGGESFSTHQACLDNSCELTADGAECGVLPACDAGATRCGATDANVVERCRADETGWETQTTCAGQLVCTTAAGAATCQTCVPGARSCGANNATVQECDADGLGYEVTTCIGNSCKLIGGVPACELPCTPGDLRCSALKSRVEVCELSGASYLSYDDCVGNTCVDEDQVYCGVPKICTANSTRCSADDPKVVERCASDGASWSAHTTCNGALECVANASGSGSCQTCIPGARTCWSTNRYIYECNPGGTAFEHVEDCLNQTCKLDSDGEPFCELPCEPGAFRCNALKSRVQVCDAAGTAWINGDFCTGNSCVEALGTASCTPPPLDCIPGETRCSTLKTQIQECSSAGTWVGIAGCPSASCVFLNGQAACGEPECAPNTPFCDEDTITYCNSAGFQSGVKEVCGADETCLTLDGIARCVGPEIPASCVANTQFCGDDGTIYYCNSQGQVSGVREVCGAGRVCVFEAGAPMCLPGEWIEDPDDPSGPPLCVVSDPRSCIQLQRGGTARGYVYAEVEKPSCDEPSTIVRECDELMECRDGSCVSTVLDEDSPYYPYSCQLNQQLAHPTSLPADCRCLTNNAPVSGVPICGRPYDRAAAGIWTGSGPRVFGLANGRYTGGFIAGDELFLGASWGPSSEQRGAVLRVDLTTGDRVLVSGELGDAPVGSGPAFSHVHDVRAAPGGQLAVLTHGGGPGRATIALVNPTSGARTVVWRGQDPTFGQCAAGDPNAASQGVYLQVTPHGFEVDASGRYYLGYANPVRDGRGVVRISADGASCEFIAATGTRADGLTRGSGPELGGFVQGFTLRPGELVVQTTQPKSLVRVDLATGDRAVIFSSGTGGSIGERWSAWDATRGVFWTAGFMNSVTVVGVDATTGARVDIFASCGDPAFPWLPLCVGAGPLRINSLNYGGMFLHPTTGNLFFAQDRVSVVELEVSTGNSIIRSL